jgi:hypothetical protein
MLQEYNRHVDYIKFGLNLRKKWDQILNLSLHPIPSQERLGALSSPL